MLSPDKVLTLVVMIIYWAPIFLYLIVWSIKIRWHVRKHKIKSLDAIHPRTYKIGKLTDFQKLGEVLIYGSAVFLGIFMFLTLPKNMIKNSILPDE